MKRDFFDETPYQTRYYIAYLDECNNIINADYRHIAIVNIDMIINQVEEINQKKNDKGYIDNFRYGRFESEDGTMIIGIDCSTPYNSKHSADYHTCYNYFMYSYCPSAADYSFRKGSETV